MEDSPPTGTPVYILFFAKVLPNICSLTGLLCAVLAVYYSILGLFPAAMIGLIWALFFDWTDGIIAFTSLFLFHYTLNTTLFTVVLYFLLIVLVVLNVAPHSYSQTYWSVVLCSNGLHLGHDYSIWLAIIESSGRIKKQNNMTDYRSLRKCISDNDNELVIYGSDTFSQFPKRNSLISLKCDRALAAASSDDLVLLRTILDHDYYDWLRSCGLGPNHVVEFQTSSTGKSLSELIIEDPSPVLKVIKEVGRKPVYTPWFNGAMETKAADAMGAELFGASHALTLKYNDKAEFKSICRQLSIPVIQGESFSFNPKGRANCQEMIAIVTRYLVTHETVIIRGTLGESGMSLYKTT